MGSTEVQLQTSGITGSLNISDRCSRLLGELCFAGSPIDPRAIRALNFLTDSVDTSGSTVTANLGTIADVATQTTLALIKAKTDNLDTALSTRLKPADTLTGVTNLTNITNALPSGTNILGKVGIDQTIPGTTNKVTVGSDVVHNIIDSGSTVVTQGTGTNLHTVVDSGTVTANAGTNLNTSELSTEDSLIILQTSIQAMLDRLDFGLLTDNAKRLKITIDAGTLPAVTTVTTVTTTASLTNQVRIGDVQAQRIVEAQLDSAFNLGILNHVVF